MSDAPGKISIAIEKTDRAVIARLQLKMMDDNQLNALRRSVDDAAGTNSGIALVVLDLGKVAILPSLALGLLVQIANKCRARQQKLVLTGVQPQVRQVFAVTRLDRVFEFAASAEAALE